MPVAGPAAVAFEADCFFTDAGVVVPGVAAWVGLAVLAAVVLGAEAFFFVEATGVAGADHHLVRPGAPLGAIDEDDQRMGGDHGAAPQLQHRPAASTRIASQTSSITPRFAWGTDSDEVWLP